MLMRLNIFFTFQHFFYPFVLVINLMKKNKSYEYTFIPFACQKKATAKKTGRRDIFSS